jgi:uncharacterized protein HemY
MNPSKPDTETIRTSCDAVSTSKPEARSAHIENVVNEQEDDEEWKLTLGKLMAMLVSS